MTDICVRCVLVFSPQCAFNQRRRLVTPSIDLRQRLAVSQRRPMTRIFRQSPATRLCRASDCNSEPLSAVKIQFCGNVLSEVFLSLKCVKIVCVRGLPFQERYSTVIERWTVIPLTLWARSKAIIIVYDTNILSIFYFIDDNFVFH